MLILSYCKRYLVCKTDAHRNRTSPLMAVLRLQLSRYGLCFAPARSPLREEGKIPLHLIRIR